MIREEGLLDVLLSEKRFRKEFSVEELFWMGFVMNFNVGGIGVVVGEDRR